ncbi:hypothetical protein J7394_04110 [Ruegeria sp. R13_0]|nr:hypothetical protein [Ruegeria sp. R13_0]
MPLFSKLSVVRDFGTGDTDCSAPSNQAFCAAEFIDIAAAVLKNDIARASELLAGKHLDGGYWLHLLRASAFPHIGDTGEGKRSLAFLEKNYPNYKQTAPMTISGFFPDRAISDHLLDGLSRY